MMHYVQNASSKAWTAGSDQCAGPHSRLITAARTRRSGGPNLPDETQTQGWRQLSRSKTHTQYKYRAHGGSTPKIRRCHRFGSNRRAAPRRPLRQPEDLNRSDVHTGVSCSIVVNKICSGKVALRRRQWSAQHQVAHALSLPHPLPHTLAHVPTRCRRSSRAVQ